MGFLNLARPDLTCSFESQDAIGDCRDYQFRMAIGPITFCTILLAFRAKNALPLMMIVPYALGRIATGATDELTVQYLVATPMLCLGYGWGYITYAENPIRKAILTFFGCVILIIVLDVLSVALNLEEPQHVQFSNLVQMVPLMGSVFASLYSLALNGNYMWFFGLLWGISGPVLIAMFVGSHYERFDSMPALSGPRLWYSDSFITLPFVFVGQIVESMRDIRRKKKTK
eukprot:g3682.t1